MLCCYCVTGPARQQPAPPSQSLTFANVRALSDVVVTVSAVQRYHLGPVLSVLCVRASASIGLVMVGATPGGYTRLLAPDPVVVDFINIDLAYVRCTSVAFSPVHDHLLLVPDHSTGVVREYDMRCAWASQRLAC